METLLWVHSLVKQKKFLVLKDHVKLLPTTFDTINDFNLDKNKKYKLGLVYHQTKNQNIPFYQKSSEKIDISDNIQKKYKRFSKELITLVKNYNIQILDLLTCDTEPIDNIDDLEIRYSLDKTGNENGPSTNWVLESHGVNIKDEYFSNTDKFTEVLWNIDFLNTYFKKTDEDVIIPGTTDISDTRFTNYIIKESFQIDIHNKDYFPIELFSTTTTDTVTQTGTGKLALPSDLTQSQLQIYAEEDKIKTEQYQKSYHLIIDGGGINYLGDSSPTITINDVSDFPGLFSTKNYDSTSQANLEFDNHIFTNKGLGGKKLIIKNLNIDISGGSLQEGGGWIGAENFCHGGCYGQERRVEGIMDASQTYIGYTQKAREKAQQRGAGSDISKNDYDGTPFECRTDPTYNKVDITNVGQYPWTNSAIIEGCVLNDTGGEVVTPQNSGVIVGANAGTYGGIIHIIGNIIDFKNSSVDKIIGKFAESDVRFWGLRSYQIPIVKDIEGFYHINAYGTDPSLNDPSNDLQGNPSFKKAIMADYSANWMDDSSVLAPTLNDTDSGTSYDVYDPPPYGRYSSIWRNVEFPWFWPIKYVVAVSGDIHIQDNSLLPPGELPDGTIHGNDESLNMLTYPTKWWQIFTNLPSNNTKKYWVSHETLNNDNNSDGYVKKFNLNWQKYVDSSPIDISDNDRNLKIFVPGFDTPYKAPSEYLVREVIIRSNTLIRNKFTTPEFDFTEEDDDDINRQGFKNFGSYIVEPPYEIFFKNKHYSQLTPKSSENPFAAFQSNWVGNNVASDFDPTFIDYSTESISDNMFNKLTYNEKTRIIGDGYSLSVEDVSKNSQLIKFSFFNNIIKTLTSSTVNRDFYEPQCIHHWYNSVGYQDSDNYAVTGNDFFPPFDQGLRDSLFLPPQADTSDHVKSNVVAIGGYRPPWTRDGSRTSANDDGDSTTISPIILLPFNGRPLNNGVPLTKLKNNITQFPPGFTSGEKAIGQLPARNFDPLRNIDFSESGENIWSMGATNIFKKFINPSQTLILDPSFTRNSCSYIEPIDISFNSSKNIQDFIKIEYYCRCNNGIPGNKKNIYPIKFNKPNLEKYYEIIGDKNKFINYSLNHTNFENILNVFKKIGKEVNDLESNLNTDFLYLIENSIEKIPMGGLGRLNFSANSYVNNTLQRLIPDISGGVNGFDDLDMFKARVQYVGTNSENHFNEMVDGSTDNIFIDMKKHQDKILEKITDFSSNIQEFINWCTDNTTGIHIGDSGDSWSNIISNSQDDYLNMPWNEWDPDLEKPSGSFINSSREIDVSNVTTQQYKAIIYELTYLVNKEKYNDISGAAVVDVVDLSTDRKAYKASYFNFLGSSNGYGTAGHSFLDLPTQLLTNSTFQELKKTIITIFLMIKHKSKFYESSVDFRI